MIFIFRVSFTIFNCERVSINIEDLKIFESCLFVCSSAKISDDLLETFDKIISN